MGFGTEEIAGYAHLSLALPLLAALIAAACGTAIALLGPRARANRLGALLMASIALWACCEVIWKNAPDAASALFWHRVAAVGIVFLGAHAVGFIGHLRQRRLPELLRVVPWLYAANAGVLLLTWTTDLVLARMEASAWGYVLVPGPLLPVWFAFTAAIVGWAIVVWVRVARAEAGRDGADALRVGVGAACAVLVAGGSDVLLAVLEVPLPRVGSLAVSTVGVAALLALGRLGASPLNTLGLTRHVFRTLPDGAAVVGPGGRVRVANPRMAELLGGPPAEVAGLVLARHLDPPATGAPQRATEGELRRLDGTRIPVALSTTALRRGRRVLGELVILRDLREVVALRARLATSERLAVVGQLASGIAHEINNPLAFVRANLVHLHRERAVAKPGEERGAEPDDLEEVLEESLEGVERALRVVEEVSAFSYAGGDQRQPVAVDELVEQALAVARMGLGPGVRIEQARAEGAEVHASPQRLKQVFLNLLVNATQAIGERGCIRVASCREGDRVVVTIADDGRGIARDDLPRVFDPFFTAWPAGQGTGLGLALAHEIVRSHEGGIEVASEPGVGTTVRVNLPRLVRPSPS